MGSKIYQDLTEIRKTLEIFMPNGKLIEIRTVSGKPIYSGYFKEIDGLLKNIENSQDTWYFVLNEINDGCYSREQRGKIIPNPQNTTKDNDISGRDWILIDADPKRSVGVGATDEEKANAKHIIGKVYNWLKIHDFEEPVMADSGNGYHLIYRVELINDDNVTGIIKNFLNVLETWFGNEHVSIDTSVFNASRITKLYGTLTKKGYDDPERPHRLSRITYVPEEIKKTRLSAIQEVAAMLPKYEQNQPVYNRPTPDGYEKRPFDLLDFMSQHGIRIKKSVEYSGGIKFILDECVFNPAHTAPDAAVFLKSDGSIGYKCFHNTCSNYHWHDVRLKFEPDAYDRANQYNGARYISSDPMPNYRNKNYNPAPFVPKVEPNEPKLYETEQIRLLVTPPEEFIKTGINVIDQRMRGLKKGFVTCLSGLRGAGKSSIISQIAIETVQQGYKAVLFSGELTAKNTYKWLILQAAGKDYVRPTQFDNYFVVNESCEEPISKWLNEKVYIYNNNYGNDFNFIKEKLSEFVKEKNIDLIILDNLMSMNINMLSEDKYSRQSLFVEQLENFAKANNLHIIFVAHPRKAQGFLRLDDVSGSGDITNRVDNAFILHRVNDDFKRNFSDYYPKHPKKAELESANNVIEICKDRGGGVQDLFIPLYFEKSCKRLKNSPHENKYYDWQKPNSGLIEVESDDDLPEAWL